MAALRVVDFDDPEIGVEAALALDIGVEGFLVAARNRLHPHRLALAAHGAGEQLYAGLATAEHLDQHRPGPRIALADDHGEGPGQLCPADQSADPDVGG